MKIYFKSSAKIYQKEVHLLTHVKNYCSVIYNWLHKFMYFCNGKFFPQYDFIPTWITSIKRKWESLPPKKKKKKCTEFELYFYVVSVLSHSSISVNDLSQLFVWRDISRSSILTPSSEPIKVKKYRWKKCLWNYHYCEDCIAAAPVLILKWSTFDFCARKLAHL